MRKFKIGITVGDPAGVGSEITKLSLKEPRIKNLADFLIIDNSRKYKIKLGFPSRESGKCALENIEMAAQLLKSKVIDALVTAPVSKEAIQLAHPGFIGHTEYLAQSFKVKNVVMSFVSEHFRLALATTHVPLNQVAAKINPASLFAVIKIYSQGLNKYFAIRNPRIAVCGLNPHAGEGGILGAEEKVKIVPAINQAKRSGLKVFGPFPADSLFYDIYRRKYDACIAMYHDQGLVPLKMIDKYEAVNMTLGLPFIRTSPSHGTAFDIAGKSKADPSSMIEAIKLAASCLKASCA